MKTHSIRKARLAAIAVIGFALAFSSALQAQNTWYFVGGTGTGSPMIELNNWNSVAGGGGDVPTSFDTSDTWILNSRGTRVGNSNNDTFVPTLTSMGAGASTEVAALNWSTKKTYLTQVDIGAGNALFTTARDSALSGLGITTLNANGAFVLRGHTTRPLEVYIDNLNGTGFVYAGDGVTGLEAATTYLSIGNASNFSGQVRFRNTTGGFLGDTDLSSAELFIQQADDLTKVTTFDVRHNITVNELNLGGIVFSGPATYSASDLTDLLTGQRIQFLDNGGSLTVIPEPSTYGLILGCLLMGALFLRRRKVSK